MSYEATTGGSNNRQTITAFFDSRTEADRAVNRLIEAGFSRDNIRLVPGSQGSGTSTTTPTASTAYSGTSTPASGEGFWDSLKDLFLPDEDRHAYAEGLRRGGYLVTVTTGGANYERALDILEREGTVDIGERESAWRSEGWSGYEGADYAGSRGLGATGAAALGTAGSAGTGAAAAAKATGTRASDLAGNEEVIPVVEERLRIGKRDVSHGRVRVRSYVVETPVNEQVTLREERVEVERRPVDRPVTDADRLFQERTIEVAETAEEAVVAKEARIKEELVVKKDVEERTQTVSDTVRRTEVEVEDERGTRTAGTTGTGTGVTGATTGTTRRTP